MQSSRTCSRTRSSPRIPCSARRFATSSTRSSARSSRPCVTPVVCCVPVDRDGSRGCIRSTTRSPGRASSSTRRSRPSRRSRRSSPTKARSSSASGTARPRSSSRRSSAASRSCSRTTSAASSPRTASACSTRSRRTRSLPSSTSTGTTLLAGRRCRRRCLWSSSRSGPQSVRCPTELLRRPLEANCNTIVLNMHE